MKHIAVPHSRTAALLVCAAVLTASASLASTIEVKQDGTGNATTIQGGIALAVPGDTVLVHPGVYLEAVLLNKAIELRSVTGPGDTIIDAVGQGAPAVRIQGAVTTATVFEGFGVRRGTDISDAGGIAVVFCSPVVRNNIVSQNQSHGMSARGAGTPLFEGNFVTANQESGFHNWSSSGTIRNNQFVGNSTYGIELHNTFPPVIEGNLIARNRLGGIEGAIPNTQGTLEIRNNTIVRNRNGIHLSIYGETVTLRRNIVTSNLRQGIRAGDQEPTLPLLIENDVWNNHAGDYVGVTPGPSDISANPVFCAPGALDYRVWWRSPCVLGPGAWIGAFGPGC